MDSMSLVLGEKSVFETVKRTLESAGFDEIGLATAPGPEDPKGLLASLFLQAKAVDVEKARRLLPGGAFEAFTTLGLIEPDEDPAYVKAGALLYPLHGSHFASDFPGPGSADDWVFPAISVQTHEYLSFLPPSPCEALLEVGTGSGAAALLAAASAKRVWAGDVSSRCLLFAEFNRRLNGVENAEVIESDVYGGLPADQTLDRVIAHPPYVPWTGEQEIYRHAGPDGEAVLRRIVGGLAERLRPGGRCYVSAMGADTHDEGLEHRLRAMIGERHAEFDVLVVEREILTPVELVIRWSEEEKLSFEQAWSLSETFLKNRVRRLVRCSIAIARRPAEDADLEPLTERRLAGNATGSAEIEAVLDRVERPWMDWDARLRSKPELDEYVRLETIAEMDGDDWRSRRMVLDAQHPFAFRTDCPLWAAGVLAKLDGETTLSEALSDVEEDPDEVEIFLECLFDAGVLTQGPVPC